MNKSRGATERIGDLTDRLPLGSQRLKTGGVDRNRFAAHAQPFGAAMSDSSLHPLTNQIALEFGECSSIENMSLPAGVVVSMALV